MAARVWVAAVCGDGSDGVHVVTGCGFREVYASAERDGANAAHAVRGCPPSSDRDRRRMTVSGATLALARAVVGVIGAGALIMATIGLISGESLTDPVFPAGLAMGASAVGAAIWVATPGIVPAIVTWLGLLGLGITVVAFGSIAFQTPSPDVLALFAIPAAIVVVAVVRMAIARLAVRGA
jgi:hypothetical protein